MTESFAAALKVVFRNRQNVFWGFAFPLLFVLAFSLFRGGSQVDVRTEIFAPASGRGAEVAEALRESLRGLETFSVSEVSLRPPEDLSDGLSKVEADKLDLAVVVEEVVDGTAARVAIRGFYDEADVLKKEVALGALRAFVDKTNLEAAGISAGFVDANFEPVASRTVNFFDFTLAGFIAYGVASISVIGMASAMAGYKQQQIIKRLACTPASPVRFMLAHVGARLVLSALQVVVIVAVARLLGAHVYGNPAWAVVLVVGGNLIFVNLGMALAGSIRGGPEAASAAGTAITLPMFILSGSFFSLGGLPLPVRLFAQALPLTPLVQGTRRILLEGASLLDLGPQVAGIAIWILLTTVLATAGSRSLLAAE